jgi:hypothetical protein
MTASGRRRRGDELDSWAGHGIPVRGAADVDIVIAPGLEDRLRRLIASMDGLDEAERIELLGAFEALLRSTFRRSSDRLGRDQRERIDALLRKAGLPPLG